MNRDYASLLAQVIPVVALALGLEIRSMVSQIRASDRKLVPPWRRTLLTCLCATLFVLACAEVRALAAVSGGAFIRSWTFMLIFAIVAAFMAPAFDAFSEADLLRIEDLKSLRDKSRRPTVIAALLGIFVIFSSLFSIVISIL